MRKLFTAAAAALLVATSFAAPLAAQTLTIAPSPAGDEFGPFGQDPNLLTFTTIGQTFVPLNGFLQSFAFFLRDDAGTGASLVFRASIADFTGGTLGAVLYTSGNVQGTSNATTGGVRVAFDPSGVPLNLPVDPARTYLAFLSIGATNGLFSAGTNALTLAGGNTYAAGQAFVDIGNGLEPLSPLLGLDAESDLAFDATFSARAISAVPEPATVLLVAGGLTLVAAARRRTTT